MQKSELFELIESYLDDTLSEENRRQVEQRMATDENFLREVDLHRALQDNFKDPGRWKLRSTLSEVIKESLPVEEPSNQRNKILSSNLWKWIIILAAIFIAIGSWYWWKPATEKSNEEPVKTQPANQPSVPMANGSFDTVQTKIPEEKLPPSRESDILLAEADPENFETNSSLEALVNSTSRGNEMVSFVITSPINATSFNPTTNGEIIVRFAGALEGISDGASQNSFLSIFNNKNASKPLLSVPIAWKKDKTGWAFDMQQRFKFPLGLYYFTIDQDGDVVYTGKFTIGSLKK